MCRKAFPLLFLMLFLCTETWAQRIVFWNVENLFDCNDDSLKDDQQFLPEGSYRWTRGRYWKKLDNLSKTIAAIAGEDAWPMIVGMCEVENEYVRGIDVAMLYDSTQFQLLGHEAVRIPSAELGYRPTRDILHVWGQCPSVPDTLHLVVVHLPSRAGSGREGTEHRRLAVKTLCDLLDELAGKMVLLMGDFNAEPNDKIFRDIYKRMTSLMPQRRKELLQAKGTYFFRKQWSYLDHILVSPSMLPMIEKRINVGQFSFLLTKEGVPFRTFQGPVYKGGVSDHLPIWVDLLSK